MDTSNIGILIDSALDLDKNFRSRKNVRVVPVYVNFGEKSYKDRVDISIGKFFEMIETSKEWPTTSQPPPSDFYEAYDELAKETKTIYSFHISSKLSGTIQSAQIASKQFMEDNPDVKIKIIDTKSLSIGGQVVIEKFLQFYSQSKSEEEVWEPLQKFIDTFKVYIALYTLEYLVKGGRLKKSRSFIANLFNYKPLLILDDGELKPYKKARGYDKIVKLGVEEAFSGRKKDDKFKFVIAVVQDHQFAKQLLHELNEQYPNATGSIMTIGPALSVHAGPRAVCTMTYD